MFWSDFNWKQNNTYGLIIIFLTILTRIFIVSISWSYGVFLIAIKDYFSVTSFWELSLIAGLAHGMGSIISPVYIVLSNKLGIRKTFFIGLLLCLLSLLTSSFVPNQHFLLFTYSIPYGIGSSIVFVLGSIVTGMYFPPNSKYYVTASVFISMGFPLGFLVINHLTDFIMNVTGNNWQSLQRVYCVINVLCITICLPLFTEKYAEINTDKNRQITQRIYDKGFLLLQPNQISCLVRFFWWIGIFFNSCANNSILIYSNSYFKSIGLKNIEPTLGIADLVFRILLSIFGRFLVDRLTLCYTVASVIGSFVCLIWSLEFDSAIINILLSIGFSVCPAVFMSLMYSVNSEIVGSKNIGKSYTYNVMVSGAGIIFGPFISGFVLDKSEKNFTVIFKLSLGFYLISSLLFAFVKYLINNCSPSIINIYDDKLDVNKSDYEEFENEES